MLLSENVGPGESSDQNGNASGLSVSEGLEFKLNEDEMSDAVSGIGSCTDTDIVIPAEYDGLPVTSIGDWAFGKCSRLTNITVPDSMTSIGDNAFSGCRSLTGITIPNGVTSIGCSTFFDCKNLTNITIPSGVTSIESYAFCYCENLTNIAVPSGVTSIGDQAFSDCDGLVQITVEKGNPIYHSARNCLIETESKTLIAGCKNSTIPSDGSVTSIGNNAFSGRISLIGITIPNGVTSIGSSAFESCSNLTDITVPNSVTSIGDLAFKCCENLATITFKGTEEQWDAIEKEDAWDVLAGNSTSSGTYTIVFSPEK